MAGYAEEGGDAGREREGSRLTARFRFAGDFVGFAGHFPDRAVLPGVCQIQCVKAVLERWTGVPVSLREIVSAKYLVPVGPGEEILCVVRDLSASNGECALKASLHRGAEKISEFRLRLALRRGGKGG